MQYYWTMKGHYIIYCNTAAYVHVYWKRNVSKFCKFEFILHEKDFFFIVQWWACKYLIHGFWNVFVPSNCVQKIWKMPLWQPPPKICNTDTGIKLLWNKNKDKDKLSDMKPFQPNKSGSDNIAPFYISFLDYFSSSQRYFTPPSVVPLYL